MLIIAISSILFLLVFLQTSFNVGNFIVKKFHLSINKWLKIIIGFFAIVAMFQLIYYPAQWFSLPSIYLFYGGITLFVFFFFFNLYYWKNIKEVFFNKSIWIILFIVFLLFFLYMRTLPSSYWFFDDSFYLPYMYENANATHILTTEARSGFDIFKMNGLYSFQGYYLIGSFLIILMNFIGTICSFSIHYLSVIYYFLAMPTLVLFIIGIYGLCQELTKTKKQKFLFYGLYIFYSIFLPYSANILNNIFMNSYMGIFALASLMVPLIIYFIFGYLKGNHNYIPFILLGFFAMLSYASFSMFLIIVCLYSMLAYQLIKKQEIRVKDYFYLAIPLLIFICSFIFNGHPYLTLISLALITIFYLGYFLFSSRYEKINQVLLNIITWIVKLLPVLFVIGSFFLSILGLNAVSVSEFFDCVVSTFFPIYGNVEFYYFFLPITLFYLFFFFLYFYLSRKHHKISMSVWWTIIIAGVFLNPLTISFVTTCITQDVYERIFILFMNPFVFYLIIQKFLSDFKYQKLVNVGIVLLITVPPLLLLKDFHYWVNVSGQSNKEVRLSERDIDATKEIQKYMDEYKIERPSLATSSKNEFRIYNPNIEMIFTRLYNLEADENTQVSDYQKDVLFHFLTGKVSNYEIIKYGNLLDILKQNKISFVVLDQENLDKNRIEPVYETQYQLLENHFKVIFENTYYKIYFTGVEKK